MKHILVCSICGKKRPSWKSPEKNYSAKICRQCHLDNQRRVMHHMMMSRKQRQLVALRDAHARSKRASEAAQP